MWNDGCTRPATEKVVISPGFSAGFCELCANRLRSQGGYESIPIPEHGKWTVTLWHFGTDSYDYKEYVEEKYCCTWQEGQNVLNRAYNKSFRIRNKNKVRRKRQEVQERPNRPFKDALKEEFGGGF